MTPDLDHMTATLLAGVTTYGLRVVGAIVLLVAGLLASRLAGRLFSKACKRIPHADPTLILFLGNVARYAVLVFTFVAVLTTFGIATTSFVAVLGAMGLAVGLALQGTLSHFAAGIMLIILRPYHVGDVVEVSGVFGRIAIINVFYTELQTSGGVRVVIPNGKLWGEVVKVPSGAPAR